MKSAKDTAVFAVGRGDRSVSVSFFGSLGFGRVSGVVRFSDNGLFAAGLLDLAAQKVKVIQQRAEAKDYLDIHALIGGGISLVSALGAARALYPEFNAAISLKALAYFADIPSLPPAIQNDLRNAAMSIREIPRIPKLSDSLLPILS